MFKNVIKNSNVKLIFHCIRSKSNFFVMDYLKKNNSVTIFDEFGCSILLNIVKFGTDEMLRCFMNYHTNQDLYSTQDHNQVHVLFYLVQKTTLHIDLLRNFLLRTNTDIGHTSSQFGSLIFHSIKHRNIPAFNLLISLGANVNDVDNYNEPIVFYCVVHGILHSSMIIINHPDFDVNIKNSHGESILEVAVTKHMILHSFLLLKLRPNDITDKTKIIQLMAIAITNNNTILAFRLYEYYSAFVIQQIFKKKVQLSQFRCNP